MIEVIKVRGGRTGKDVHIGDKRSSQTECGKKLKYALPIFRTSSPITCLACLKLLKKRNYKILEV